MESIYAKGRDNARTPMQWTAGANASFTTGTPWIKINQNYPEVNTEVAVADPNSIYHYYRRLIELRKTYPLIVYGRYELILPDHPEIFAYTRILNDETLL
jgi:oligo-1,6-glucosidase